MRVQGGKAVYGAPIGILMLEAQFPRIPGDMGNALSWDFPVRYKVVRGASPDAVVRRDPSALLPDFIAAGRELVADGCEGITTNCGFLIRFQAQLGEALGVPVATSSLLQAPFIRSLLPPDKHLGILTISAATLDADLLALAGVPEGTPVQGTDDGEEFSAAILDDRDSLDVAAAERDLVAAARGLCAQHPGVAALLLECTNMVPYAPAIAHCTGLPVWSVHTLVSQFQRALRPTRFASMDSAP